MQHNIELVTDHIRHKLMEKGETDIERKCLRFVQAKDGKTYYKDADNLYWRVSVFIPNAVTKEEVNQRVLSAVVKPSVTSRICWLI